MQSHTSVINRPCAENGNSLSLKEAATSSKANLAAVSNGDCPEVSASKIPPPNLSDSDKEVIRLVGQHLCSLGLQKATDVLMAESGCKLEHTAASRIREQVMDGQWKKLEETLLDMKSHLKHQRHLQKMRFLIMEQKFLELLEDAKIMDALTCLRMQITPLRIFTNRVHQLSGFMMIASVQDLKRAANWDGKGHKSRAKLLEKLQGYLPISVMLPPNRLKHLLEQALDFQQTKCVYHNSIAPAQLSSCSLLADHTCLRQNFPSVTKQILSEHFDDVWYCEFSHNGTKLATGSKDSNLIIWNVDLVTHKVTHARTLTGHTYGVGYLAWSPDDTHIIACGSEESAEVWLWNVQTGDLRKKMCHSTEDSLSCCCWSRDGQKYYTGGTKGQFYQCDLEGNVLDSWEGVRVHSIGCLPDNKTILAADTQRRVRAYNFDDMTDYNMIKEDQPVISFSMSSDGKLLLLNVAHQGVHMWDVDDQILVRKFQGSVQGHFTIFSSFGGASDEFISSGSEDHKVYIWHRSREKPIEVLSGHTNTVNCVAWNRAIPSMLASVSDDCTVRIWGAPDASGSDSEDDWESTPSTRV